MNWGIPVLSRHHFSHGTLTFGPRDLFWYSIYSLTGDSIVQRAFCHLKPLRSFVKFLFWWISWSFTSMCDWISQKCLPFQSKVKKEVVIFRIKHICRTSTMHHNSCSWQVCVSTLYFPSHFITYWLLMLKKDFKLYNQTLS